MRLRVDGTKMHAVFDHPPVVLILELHREKSNRPVSAALPG